MMTPYNIKQKIEDTPELPDYVPQVAALILYIMKQADAFEVPPSLLFASMEKMGALDSLPNLPKMWTNLAKVCGRFGYAESKTNTEPTTLTKKDIVYQIMKIFDKYLEEGKEEDHIPAIDMVCERDFIEEISLVVYELYPPDNLGEAVNEIFQINETFVQLLAFCLTLGRALGSQNVQFQTD